MSIKHDKTWQLLEALLTKVSSSSPINMSFILSPIHSTCIRRIKALEETYSSSSIYNFFIKRAGIYPVVLFTLVTCSLVFGAQRAYTRSTQLVIHLVAVLYPTFQCWQLIKNKKQDDIHQLKSWLTYWILFGSFQVLDHYMKLEYVTMPKHKYNLYKLFILYWAQSPHSNGAELIYRHVLQKPEEQEPQDEKVIPLLNKEQEQDVISGYRFLDGYNPPNLLNSNSSDDDESIKSIHIDPTTDQKEENFPSLEPAW